MLTFKCPHCQQVIETEDENAGQEATCPNCSKPIVVPSTETSSQPEESQPAESASSGASGHWKLKKTVKESPTVQTKSGEAPIATPIPMPPVRPFSVSKPSNLSMATTALVLGILSFIGIPLCGLLALILGIIALSKISRSNGMLLGKGKAIVGVIFGCWSIVRLVLAFSLLLPMLAKARERAREISCTSNLKMICTAHLMYCGDYDDYIPTSMEKIQSYIGPNKLKCPAIDASKPYSPDDDYALLSAEKYAIQSVVKNMKELRITQFKRPSETPIIMCTRHKNVDIIGYMDGHVEVKPKQSIPQP